MPDEHITDKRDENDASDLTGGADAATGSTPTGPADEDPGHDAPERDKPERDKPERDKPERAKPERDKPERAKKKKSFGREMFTIIGAAIVLTLLIKIFIIQVYEIPSVSMQNTLMVGDRVLVNKLIYHFRNVARGDIIVFSGAGSWGDLNGNPIPPPPGNPVERGWDDVLGAVGLRSDTTYYIKRVIGLPGDHIYCNGNGGPLEVNGVALDEKSFLIPGAEPSTIPVNVTVPAGRLYVLGDNRPESEDSRYHGSDGFYGTIPENEVAGRAFLIIWPLSRFGDLPIPSTFNQAALHTSASGAAVLRITAAAAGAGPAGWVTGATIPLLIWRWNRRRNALCFIRTRLIWPNGRDRRGQRSGHVGDEHVRTVADHVPPACHHVVHVGRGRGEHRRFERR
jgi:signal peptidase I